MKKTRIEIDKSTHDLLELVAADLNVSTDEAARELLQAWLKTQFERN